MHKASRTLCYREEIGFLKPGAIPSRSRTIAICVCLHCSVSYMLMPATHTRSHRRRFLILVEFMRFLVPLQDYQARFKGAKVMLGSVQGSLDRTECDVNNNQYREACRGMPLKADSRQRKGCHVCASWRILPTAPHSCPWASLHKPTLRYRSPNIFFELSYIT